MIYIGCDRAGTELKAKILAEYGDQYVFADCGFNSPENLSYVLEQELKSGLFDKLPQSGAESAEETKAEETEEADDEEFLEVDYPDVARTVCEGVLSDSEGLGILICGTGIGMSIAANKFVGIRAAVCGDLYSSLMARQHNDANVICIGARVTGDATALEMVDTWLASEFEGGRHARRLEKISALEYENFTFIQESELQPESQESELQET